MASNRVDQSSTSRPIYRPLSTSRKEIRILWLLPPSSAHSGTTTTSKTDDRRLFRRRSNKAPKDPIRAELVTVSLLDKPAYAALSYVWGNPNGPKYQIILNGQPFEVRANLYLCLLYFWEHWIGIQSEKPPEVDDPNAERERENKPHRGPGPLRQLWTRIRGQRVHSIPGPVWDPDVASHVLGLPLWIDAVCINQGDDAERSSQVQMMGDLYSNAAAVISWLGHNLYRMIALKAIRELAQAWKQHRESALADQTNNPSTQTTEMDTATTVSPSMLNSLVEYIRSTENIWKNERLMGLVLQVFNNDYWRRIWIVQEVVLASPSSHVYMCGHVMVSEADFNMMTEFMPILFGPGDAGQLIRTRLENDLIFAAEVIRSAIIHCRLLDELTVYNDLMALRGQVQPGWMFVLQIASQHLCTDPHDIVYGLFNLIPQTASNGSDTNGPIIADYKRPVKEVYIDWMLRASYERGNLDLLMYAGIEPFGVQIAARSPATRDYVIPGSDLKKDFGLPSWVPDLYNYKGHRTVDWTQAKTNGGTGTNIPFKINITQQNVLIARARRISTVATNKVLQNMDTFIQLAMSFLKSRKTLGYPAAGIPPLQALARLALHDLISQLDEADANPTSGKQLHILSFAFFATLSAAILDALKKKKARFMSTKRRRLLAGEILGLDIEGSFPDVYRHLLFPNVDVGELLGWTTPDLAQNDTESLQIDIVSHLMNWCDGAKTVFETESGHIGAGPGIVLPGDLVYKVENCRSPLVFRLDSSKMTGQVTLVGSCHVVGVGDETDDDPYWGEYDEELHIC